MAQNQFINVTADANAVNKPDNSDHRHSTSNGAAAAGDLTLSWDSAKFPTVNTLRSAVDQVVRRAMGQMK
jgi:hypothetical protein